MDELTIQRVKAGLCNPAIGPETIALMMTRVCNLSCVYCRGGRDEQKYKGNTDISDELTTEELFSLFKEARDFQVKEINLGGMDGEPFCKKDILKILQKIKELGFMGSMTTNGSFLNSQIAEKLTEYGWDILLLSFDSHNEAVQHAARPAVNKKPYFQNIIGFLDTLKDIKSNLRVLLNVVITRLNYRDFAEFIKFANYYPNIQSINILKMLDLGLVKPEEIRLSDNELKDFRSILKILKNEEKLIYQGNWLDSDGLLSTTVENSDDNCMNVYRGKKLSRCFTNYYILSIDSNGDVLRCPQHQKVVADFNIKSTPLSKLWQGEHLQFRQGLAEYADCFEGCCTILKEQNKLILTNLIKKNAKK